MITFIVACAGLILFSSLFYLFPPARFGATEEDLDRVNLEWFRRRRAEVLEEGNDGLEEDVRLRLLEDEHRGSSSKSNAVLDSTFPVWVLLPLVALTASVLYYFLGAATDVTIANRLHAMQEGFPQDQMSQLVQDVEKRSAQRPENLHYLALLARHYMDREDYEQAAQTYGALALAAPEDAQTLAYAAQAQYLARGRTLSEPARLQAEQALAVDPQQRTALGLLGMASFERQQYAVAIGYWQRLLAMEPADSEGAQMISGVIETARQRLDVTNTGAADSVGTATSNSAALPSIGVTLRVAAPTGADIAPGDTVFILARNATSGSRMPIAVHRLTGAELPATVRLDDSNSMAGQKLSLTSSVIVAVQVSPDGRPGEDNASWIGQVDAVVPSQSEDPVQVELQPNAAKAR